ncbi:MAG: gliding motility-associated C-terminal domain-containing protein [Algoriphagus sp.]|uniref:Ig-like domain-containing protein n=1 Tax=Algoriphagus sp. TaxID=1872435 RepID=UPI0026165078|nr:gliding motility-associated C-terminal domain-containing protein [Algoriphagus sp.]MDG1278314.1 gliding motility-associated C-terminal domain-containing protein [Algoriphagus sp.]
MLIKLGKTSFLFLVYYFSLILPTNPAQIENQYLSRISEDLSCTPSDSEDIQGEDQYFICSEDEKVTFNVFSTTVSSPIFSWYADYELTELISQGSSLTIDAPSESSKLFVAVEGTDVCKTVVGDAKEISVIKDQVLEPVLPEGDSYFSPQGLGVAIKATYAIADPDNVFEFIWFDSYGRELAVTDHFFVDRELPRGVYIFSVLSRNSLSGCISSKVEFSVIVEPAEISLDNCNISGSSTIISNLCPSCVVANPDGATDNNPLTNSEIKTTRNVFAGGFIGQNLIFPITGSQGDSVKVNLSFPDLAGALPNLSSVSLTLFNGTRKVSSEYFLNSPEVSVKQESGQYSFTIFADLLDESEAYVSVLVKSYSSLTSSVPRIAVHSTEMFFAVPNIPTEPVEICDGNSKRLVVTPGQNTFLRWYSEKVGGTELSSGSGYTTPVLNTPGVYTYWIAIFRSNCESSLRYPYSVEVKALPTSDDLVVSGDGFHCYGDIIELNPEISPSSSFLSDELQFEWFIDSLGVEKLSTDRYPNLSLTSDGTLVINDAQPGNYKYFLGSKTNGGCTTLSTQLKRVNFQVGPIIPVPVFPNNSPSFCLESNKTLGDIPSLSSNYQINWYTDESRTVQLPLSTRLTDGGKYYAVSRNSQNCESLESTMVEVQLISCSPVLRLEKLPNLESPFEIFAGNEISYTVSIANDGIFTAYDLLIEDVLPSGTRYVSSSPAGAFADNKVSWQLDSLSGSDSVQYVLRLQVLPSFAIGTFLRNTASVIGEDVPGGKLEAEAEPVLVTRNSSVEIEKVLLTSSPVYPGDSVGYQISVWNSGPTDSDKLTILDVLAAELGYISSESGTFDASKGQVEWAVPVLAPGDTLRYELLVRVSESAEPGLIGNTAIVQNSAGEQEDSDNAEAVEVIPHFPEVKIRKSPLSGLTVDAGTEFEYSITVSNSGKGTAYDLVIEDVLPSGTSYVSSSPAGAFTDNKISWQLDSLAGSDSVQYVLRLQVLPSFAVGTFLRNTASVSGDDVPGGKLEAEAEPVLVTRNSSVEIEKVLLTSSPVYPGDTVGYQISVWNSGPTDSDKLTILDVLAAELGYISSESGTYDASKRQVEWSIPALAPGDTLRYELLVQVSESAEPGLIGNTAIVQNSEGGQEDSDSAEELEVLKVEIISLALEKVVLNGEVRIGNDYRYGIFLKNTGSIALKNVIIRDTLSSNLTYKSSNITPLSTSNGRILWEFPVLDPGDSIQIEILVSLEYNKKLIGGEIENSVWVSVENSDQIWFDTVSSLVLSPAQTKLAISKTLNQVIASEGDIITYDVKIQNIGESIAYGVLIKDFYPEGLQYVGVDGPGSIQNDENVLSIFIDKILPGEEISIQLSFILLEFNEEMINVAELSSDNAPDEKATAGPIILKQVDLEIIKTVSSQIIEVGSEFSYSIVIINNSQIVATNVLVTDILPVEVEYLRHENIVGLLSYSNSEGKIEWLIDSLDANEKAELKIFVKAIKEGSQVINQASVTSEEEDSNVDDNQDTVSHLQVSLHFPNVFTPNGDGVNDLWTITGLELFPNNSIQVVNRWGSVIFKSESYLNNWSGGDLLEGTYFYLFKWKDSDQNHYEKSGFITLVR